MIFISLSNIFEKGKEEQWRYGWERYKNLPVVSIMCNKLQNCFTSRDREHF